MSAGDVEHRVRVAACVAQQLDRFVCPDRNDLHPTTPGFFEHGGHHGERSLGTGSHDEARALPGDLFFHREWRVAVLIAELPGGFLLPQPDLAAVDHHVTVVGLAVDADGAESEPVDSHAFSVERPMTAR